MTVEMGHIGCTCLISEGTGKKCIYTRDDSRVGTYRMHLSNLRGNREEVYIHTG